MKVTQISVQVELALKAPPVCTAGDSIILLEHWCHNKAEGQHKHLQTWVNNGNNTAREIRHQHRLRHDNTNTNSVKDITYKQI